MISLEEVKKLADLARIELGEKEAKELQKELEPILDYVSKLKEAPLRKEISDESDKGVPKIFNVLRNDEPVSDDSDVKKGEHFKVKHIL